MGELFHRGQAIFMDWMGDLANLLLLNPVHRRYDYYSFDHATRKEDEPGLYQSAKWMHDLITKEQQEYDIKGAPGSKKKT